MLSEEVEDEILALESIYDSLFSRTDGNHIRAVISPAEEDHSTEHDSASVLYLEATLPPDYPEQCTPNFSLDNLNNSHWSADLKQQILSSLQEQATEQLGTCCLYTVIEWAREQLPGWLERLASSTKQHDTTRKEHVPVQAEEDDAAEESQTKFMSKAQKRRHYDRFGATNEKPRGHDWIDIVAHLARR
ncbi:probable RWD domain-containing protein 4 [Coccomyxa sp. Obi]|nr:probable RWD domain-containing protein 4 [Coccomyxa sp. Obi]